MKELEYMKKVANPVSKAPPKVSQPPKMKQLRTMSTDELFKLLMSPELAQPVNAAFRQQIIEILRNGKALHLPGVCLVRPHRRNRLNMGEESNGYSKKFD
jgi:hypothetical protein